MGQNKKTQGIMWEWYNSFVANLKTLAESLKFEGVKSDNDVYISIGTTQESKKLIAEQVSELDEEYALRRELENEKDPEIWFKRKVVETVDELHHDGILEEAPNQNDYDKVYNAISDAINEGIADEAEQTAKELNIETDALVGSEENAYKANEEVKLK